MKAFCFFSVHEVLFDPVAAHLTRDLQLSSVSGFVWGRAQEAFLRRSEVPYGNLSVFTRDVLPAARHGRPDYAYLAEWERKLEVPIHRIAVSDRHLVQGCSYDEVMRRLEVTIRHVDRVYRRERPDFVFSEDVSCATSYIHFALARHYGIPYWCIGSARIPNRLSVYRSGVQRWESTNDTFARFRREGLGDALRADAENYVRGFRMRPERPTGMETRARVPSVSVADLGYLRRIAGRWAADPADPTMVAPWQAMRQRARRLARQRGAEFFRLLERPRQGDRYVVYPIHFQPEASTLVQAPYYLDQPALIADIAKSLPVGVQLYVKEHVSNRGRRPLEFYRRIRETLGVRLLHPDVDTWSLVRGAEAIAVITGTMGWEGLLFGKPVVTFGEVFYNVVPGVHRAGLVSKEEWATIFARAVGGARASDEDVVRYVAALQATSSPGFMKNPNTFPQVLESSNVRAIADAIVSAVRTGSAGDAARLVAD